MFLTDRLPSRPYDYYVIGAGPAGITLSLELAKANRTVLLFETGTVTEPRAERRQLWALQERLVGSALHPRAGRHVEGLVGLVCDADGGGLRQPGCRCSMAHREVRSGAVLSARRHRRRPRAFHPRCRDAAGAQFRLPPLLDRCFRHQLLLPRPYLVLTKPLRLDIQCQRAASVKIGWKYLND